MFHSSFQVAISRSGYFNLSLKPKQVKCLEVIYSGRDVVAVLQTGYGNSLMLHLPSSLLEKLSSQQPVPSLPFRPVVIVVSPLNAFSKDQIRWSTDSRWFICDEMNTGTSNYVNKGKEASKHTLSRAHIFPLLKEIGNRKRMTG